MQKKYGLALALLLAFLGYKYIWMHPRSVATAAPVDIHLEPVQKVLQTPLTVQIKRGGKKFTIDMHHSYEISGEVLSSEHYDLSWTNDFFDVDTGLIWGPKIEQLKEDFTFHQSGRWLFWRWDKKFPKDYTDYVGLHVSNNHLIPAEGHKQLGRAIRWIGEGDHVRIKGYLVDIKGTRFLQKSSTTRSDHGNGACEIIWVTELQIGTKIYR